MTWLDALAILAAGAGAGTINAVVGSGSLVTFPTLLALGYPPVVANVSNSVGLTPGNFAAMWGYRTELSAQRDRIRVLAPLSAVGGLAGAPVLLRLPASVFEAVVPALIAVAVLLVVVQPRLAARLAARDAARPGGGRKRAVLLPVLVLLTGVYGGYFGAAQGVILLAILGLLLSEDLPRANGLKNLLAGVANLVAGVVFVLVADVDWAVAGIIALGATIGGLLGGRVARVLPAPAFRVVVVIIGLVALVSLLR